MADGHGHEMIIVRRHEEEEHEHHSSAWKVAHADFMTAMMAFFLIMWLINVTDDQVRKGISQYFNPIHMSEGSSELKGLNKPSGDENKAKDKGHSDSPLPSEAMNLLKLSAGHADSIGEGASMSPEEAASALQAAADAAARFAEAQGGSAAGAQSDGNDHGEAGGAGLAEALAALAGKGRGEADHGDSTAFQDPYAVLARIAEDYAAEHPVEGATAATNIAGDTRAAGSEGGTVDRDPFDPTYWQLSPLPEARADRPGAPGTAERAPAGATPDAAAPRPGVDVTGPVAVFPPPPAAPVPQIKAEPPAAAPKEVAPEVVVREQAEVSETVEEKAAKADEIARAAKTEATVEAVEAEEATKATEVAKAVETAEVNAAGKAAGMAAESEALAAEIETSVAKVLADGASPGITVQASEEGILVNLTDDARYSMFPVGSAVPDGKTVVLLEQIAGVLAKREGDVVIRGYTDARPFRSKDYDNWRLSAARAHMAYYMLTRGGLPEKRVVAIEGHADRSLRNPDEPYGAENRRIEVLLKEPTP